MKDILLLLVFPAIIIYAAVSDLLSMTISNRICLALTAAFFPMAFYSGMPLTDMGWHLGFALIAFVISFSLWTMGFLGGGDAKIIPATVLWLGVGQIVPFVMMSAAFGGVLAIALLRMRSLPLPESVAKVPWIAHLHHDKTGIPYGIALAVGALFVYPETNWMLSAGLSA